MKIGRKSLSLCLCYPSLLYQTSAFLNPSHGRQSVALFSATVPGPGGPMGGPPMTMPPPTYGPMGTGPPRVIPQVMRTPTDIQFADSIDELMSDESPSPPICIQGGALRTWSFADANIERLVISMSSNDRSLQHVLKEGRLLHAKVYLCQGPDNTPVSMTVKSGKGKLRPFKAVMDIPQGYGALFIKSIAALEFPVIASVQGASRDGSGGLVLSEEVYDMQAPRLVQGGAIVTFPLDTKVQSAKVILKTDGRPLQALVELVQGPNAIKTTIDLYTEDGWTRKFFTVMETPGAGNVIRIVNKATVEFPLTVSVEPFVVDD